MCGRTKWCLTCCCCLLLALLLLSSFAFLLSSFFFVMVTTLFVPNCNLSRSRPGDRIALDRLPDNTAEVRLEGPFAWPVRRGTCLWRTSASEWLSRARFLYIPGAHHEKLWFLGKKWNFWFFSYLTFGGHMVSLGVIWGHLKVIWGHLKALNAV